MSGGVTKGAVASEVRGRGRGWEMNLQETPVSNGGPRAEGGPSPRHSASGDFSGRCAHGAALRRPDGSVATAAPQPSGKEEDSCALALLTAAVSGHPEHRRLSTGTSTSLLSSAFVIFFLECPENCQNPRAHQRPLGRPHSLPSVCGHHLAKRTRAWRGCARALASFLGLGNVRSQVMTGTINAWLYLQILLWF